MTTAWILMTASRWSSGRAQPRLTLLSLVGVASSCHESLHQPIIIPSRVTPFSLPPSVPRSLSIYTIHSVDMLKRANSDKINPCIYLYDNIKLDLLKLCRVLIAIWYLDNTLMLAQTFLPTANTIRIQFRLISHFCPDPREDVSKCQISFVLDIWDEATRIKRFLNLNDIFTSTSIF